MARGQLGALAAVVEAVGLGQVGGITVVLVGEHGHGGDGKGEGKKVAPRAS
jgi:hypothetical protein